MDDQITELKTIKIGHKNTIDLTNSPHSNSSMPTATTTYFDEEFPKHDLLYLRYIAFCCIVSVLVVGVSFGIGAGACSQLKGDEGDGGDEWDVWDEWDEWVHGCSVSRLLVCSGQS